METNRNVSLDNSNIPFLPNSRLRNQYSLITYHNDLINSYQKRKNHSMIIPDYPIIHNQQRALKNWKKIKIHLPLIRMMNSLNHIALQKLYEADNFELKVDNLHYTTLTIFQKIRIFLFYFKKLWNFIFFTATLYVLLVLPYRLAFRIKYEDILGAELTVDIIFMIDAFYEFFYNPSIIIDEEYVIKIRFIELISFESILMFILRFFSAIPIQLSYPQYDYAKLIRLFEISRIHKILDLTLKILTIFLYTKASLLQRIFLTIKFLILFFLIAHFCTCIHIAIILKNYTEVELEYFGLTGSHNTKMDAYILSFSFTVYTFSTVGYANTPVNIVRTGEFIFNMILEIIGMTLYTKLRIFILNIDKVSTTLITLLIDEEYEIIVWLSRLVKFKEIRPLPEDIWGNIKDTILQKSQKGFEKIFDNYYFNNLPFSTRCYLLNFIFRDFIELFSYLFIDTSDEFINEIIIKLTAKSYSKKELLLSKGKPSYGILFIRSGQVITKSTLKKNLIIQSYEKGKLVFADIFLKNQLSSYYYQVSDRDRLKCWYCSGEDLDKIKENYYIDWITFNDNILKYINSQIYLNEIGTTLKPVPYTDNANTIEEPRIILLTDMNKDSSVQIYNKSYEKIKNPNNETLIDQEIKSDRSKLLTLNEIADEYNQIDLNEIKRNNQKVNNNNTNIQLTSIQTLNTELIEEMTFQSDYPKEKRLLINVRRQTQSKSLKENQKYEEPTSSERKKKIISKIESQQAILTSNKDKNNKTISIKEDPLKNLNNENTITFTTEDNAIQQRNDQNLTTVTDVQNGNNDDVKIKEKIFKEEKDLDDSFNIPIHLVERNIDDIKDIDEITQYLEDKFSFLQIKIEIFQKKIAFQVEKLIKISEMQKKQEKEESG